MIKYYEQNKSESKNTRHNLVQVNGVHTTKYFGFVCICVCVLHYRGVPTLECQIFLIIFSIIHNFIQLFSRINSINLVTFSKFLNRIIHFQTKIFLKNLLEFFQNQIDYIRYWRSDNTKVIIFLPL